MKQEEKIPGDRTVPWTNRQEENRDSSSFENLSDDFLYAILNK